MSEPKLLIEVAQMLARQSALFDGGEAGTKLTFGEIAERNLSNAVDAGMGEQDWSAIHELARKKARLD